MSIAPASSAPRTLRTEVVVCCATLRLSELAPDSLKPFWFTLMVWKRANGVSEARGRLVDSEPVAGLDLAGELVGAGAALRGAAAQAGDDDLPLHLVVVVAVARQRIDVEGALGERCHRAATL